LNFFLDSNVPVTYKFYIGTQNKETNTMGQYIYKVTAKTKILADGTKANISVFAYKPYRGLWGDDMANRRMAKNSGCPQAERYVSTSKNYTGKVVLGEDGDFAVPMDCGSFTDDYFYLQVSKIRKAQQ
jgi:hypothetical protein